MSLYWPSEHPSIPPLQYYPSTSIGTTASATTAAQSQKGPRQPQGLLAGRWPCVRVYHINKRPSIPPFFSLPPSQLTTSEQHITALFRYQNEISVSLCRMIRTILSYSRSSVSSSRRIALSPRFLGQRYHTYPDPDEKPIITEAKSETTRTVKKEGERFEAMKRYVVDKPFEIPHDIASGSAFKEEPKTEVTKLKNGLTIATQDMPGLMCSLSFLVKTGR